MLFNSYRRRETPFGGLSLAAVAILALILIVLLCVLVLIIALVLILILLIHCAFLRLLHLGFPWIVYPYIQDLSRALNIRLTNRPAVIAAVIPPAVAFNPPVKTPIKPSSLTASLTPFASV